MKRHCQSSCFSDFAFVSVSGTSWLSNHSSKHGAPKIGRPGGDPALFFHNQIYNRAHVLGVRYREHENGIAPKSQNAQ
jgi:hypothetical protein